MNPLPSAHTRLHFLHFALDNFNRKKAGLVFFVLERVVSRVVVFDVVPMNLLRSVRVQNTCGG